MAQQKEIYLNKFRQKHKGVEFNNNFWRNKMDIIII